MLVFFLYVFFLNFFSCFLNSWMLVFFSMMLICPFLLFLNFSSFLIKNDFFFMDIFSFTLIFLTLWICSLSLMSMSSIFSSSNFWLFLLSLNALFFILCLSFSCSNLLFFFFFFESSLIPTLIIIVGWGMKIERMKSGFFLLFYTLFGSLPLLIIISLCQGLNNSLFLGFLDFSYFNFLVFFFSILGFLIKMPMFLMHSWLPKAHVEAPVCGSMVLAGILLKLGGYGLHRFMFIYKFFFNLNYVWLFISVWGGILSSFISMRQIDMKSLVAFSSVSHMALVILGIMINFELSLISSYMMMISHGLCSSALFFLVNVVYERSGTRSILLNKGLLSFSPSLSLWWFLFCSFNMAAPPSMNLFSEMILVNCICSWSFFLIFFLMLACFLSAVYSLFLYVSLNHGKFFSNFFSLFSFEFRENLILILHLVPLVFFFLKIDFFF
uniref:NADH-ubiquinone oxidoreductase chain 4 n=1 Tax=Pseudodendrothrips mori TaxID=1291231 RepID=A0A7M3T292_9NEOP|nr:NADH dehydrogenase subunit 4 [Pseudodendrothrips mori]QFO91086.1 NADH dehydrogenase subunit 4 [Pseudodendrothrips mori]